MLTHHLPDIREDINRMRLDDSQANALVHSLETNFSLIQGPPGTGKTFIGV
jgi:superfamily II DNA or RNA helicase